MSEPRTYFDGIKTWALRCPRCLRDHRPDGTDINGPCEDCYPNGLPCAVCQRLTGLMTIGATCYSCWCKEQNR